MKKRPTFNLRLPAWHEWLIYFSAGGLLLSGLAWLFLDKFGQVQGEFGPEPHPALPWLLLLHGVIAYAFAIVSGMLFAAHMRLGWFAGRNRVSGSLLVGISLLLTVTGLGLYYATAEGTRSIASTAHWVIGLSMPTTLIVHLIRGKRSRFAAQVRQGRLPPRSH